MIDDLSSGDAARVPRRRRAARARHRRLRRAARRSSTRSPPRAIFHLAAQASVVASVEDPGRDCEVNVQGTLNVVEAAGRMRRPGRVHLDRRRAVRRRGADAHTGGPDPRAAVSLRRLEVGGRGVREDVVACPRASRTPYAGSATSTARARAPTARPAWWRSSPTTSTPTRRPKLYGHGKPTRDYVYVGDVVGALLAASGRSGTYNIATSVETDVATVWSELSEAAGKQIEPELADLRPGELQHSCLDASLRRARARLARGGADRRGPAA